MARPGGEAGMTRILANASFCVSLFVDGLMVHSSSIPDAWIIPARTRWGTAPMLAFGQRAVQQVAPDQPAADPRGCWGMSVVLDAIPSTFSTAGRLTPSARNCRAVAHVPRRCRTRRQARIAQRSARWRPDGIARTHQPCLDDPVKPRRPVDGDSAAYEAQREVDHCVIPRSASARR